jgi:hypothetical protein
MSILTQSYIIVQLRSIGDVPVLFPNLSPLQRLHFSTILISD